MNASNMGVITKKEYDFSDAVRNPYAKYFRKQGTLRAPARGRSGIMNN
jgi:hypothetical protein